MERATPEEVDRKLAEGLTVCANDIGVGDQRLTFFGRTIREQMSYVGNVWFNCYLSPDGSGANTHFDCTVTTALQIEGSKRWRYSQLPVIDLPPSNAQAREDGTPLWMLPSLGCAEWDRLEHVDEAAFNEVVLEPGDLLYLPAGTWHNAKAIGVSLALNMVFDPMSFFNFLMHIIEPHFTPHVGWRGNPPPVYYENVHTGRLPLEVQSYLRDRFQELREFIDSFNLDGVVVNDIWRRRAGY